MASLLSYFWPAADTDHQEEIPETTPYTVTIPLNEKPLVAKSMYKVLEGRLQKWYKHQQSRSSNLLRVRGYSAAQDTFESVEVITDHWPTVLEYIEDKNPDNATKTKFCLDLAKAVLNLHNNDFPHGAIRGDNVYVRTDGVCVLGLPALLDKPSPKDLEDYKRWLSPEIREPALYKNIRVDHYKDYHGNYRLPNDIYMLSSTFTEIFTGTTPTIQPIPTNAKDLAVRQLFVLPEDDDKAGKLADIPGDILPIIKQMRNMTPVHRYNADKTVDALIKPSLARRPSGNYINSKVVARGVLHAQKY
ncbi:hypothetical protein CVT24_006769 [Panaeolus cyanescens]|uniref:Protein kinase domain-containing protein n=1 Tax=Panaeolus cyanescens TaxID=181874 RepID=A0A409V9E7_9AGAR|nr:hypothetical protein CVT24_006769 [Panaeolus cyanescens]